MQTTSMVELAAATPGTAASSPTPGGLLLLAEAALAQELSRHLQPALTVPVTWTDKPSECETLLQTELIDLVLLEETVLQANPAFADSVYRLAGGALVLEINLGIAGPDRILRGIRAAQHRRRLDAQAARTAALQTLRSEFSASLTGLLLESELALLSGRTELAPALSNLITLAELLYRQMRP